MNSEVQKAQAKAQAETEAKIQAAQEALALAQDRGEQMRARLALAQATLDREIIIAVAQLQNMKKTILLLTALVSLTMASAQAHGSFGYAPDTYYRITNATTEATDLSTNSKIKLPVGCIIHVLWYKDKQLAFFQLDDGSTYSMRWTDLLNTDYLGMGLYIKRPFWRIRSPKRPSWASSRNARPEDGQQNKHEKSTTYSDGHREPDNQSYSLRQRRPTESCACSAGHAKLPDWNQCEYGESK
jgi:hypothetical protein